MSPAAWFDTIWSRLVAAGETIAALIPDVESDVERWGQSAMSRRSGRGLISALEKYEAAVEEANLFLVAARFGEHGRLARRKANDLPDLQPLRLVSLQAGYDFDYDEGSAQLDIPGFPRLDRMSPGPARDIATLQQREYLPDDAIAFFDAFMDLYVPED